MKLLGDLGRGLVDLVFAPVCVGCGGPIPSSAVDRIVCRVCWTRARPIPLPRCDRCWTPLPATGSSAAAECLTCLELRPAVRAVRAAFVLDGPVRDLVHALKYRGWSGAARSMAARMASLSFPEETSVEVRHVIAVPLAPARLRERGYNQAVLLARELAARKCWELIEHGLERGRSAGSQTTLHPTARRANVAGAFRVPARVAERLVSEHVLLVDDVWTTGATALACCDALLTAGARAVTVLTFARALPELQRLARRLDLAGNSSYPG